MSRINHLGSSPASDSPTGRARADWPARLDLAQSASGLVLGLFMWGHMFFVSSILISKDAMWTITKMFEGYFFFGRAFPGIVSVIVAAIVALFVRARVSRHAQVPGRTTAQYRAVRRPHEPACSTKTPRCGGCRS